MIERNRRIYFILMALTALASVLTVTACIVLADGLLVYSIALAVPVVLTIGLVTMLMHIYPTFVPDPTAKRQRKRRSPFVPDPMGFRWITAGTIPLGFALIWICIAMLLMELVPLWVAITLIVAILLACSGIDLWITLRIYSIAGQPVPKKKIVWYVVLEIIDLITWAI